MEIRQVKMIDSFEWDKLVQETYGRPYTFQQQNGCRDRGTHEFTVPCSSLDLLDEFSNDSIQEKENGWEMEMGVKFAVWLARDPEYTETGLDGWELGLFWGRNFYPDFGTLVNDLHSKGLIEAGEYIINIDW